MMHPLEKLAEDWGKESDSCCNVAETHQDERNAWLHAGKNIAYDACATSLKDALASLWHPFDPDDEGTWPDGGEYLTIDCVGRYGVRRWMPEYPEWSLGAPVTHYTELLPGPRAEKSNG